MPQNPILVIKAPILKPEALCMDPEPTTSQTRNPCIRARSPSKTPRNLSKLVAGPRGLSQRELAAGLFRVQSFSVKLRVWGFGLL